MDIKKALATASLAIAAFTLVGCTAVAATDAASTESSTSAADSTTTDSTASSTSEDAASMPAGGPDGGGPGGEAGSGTVATSTADLDALIDTALGDASLGIHRGHQPIESVLDEVLGISHAELHARMDAGQNLAAVATDLGIDPQALIDALVADFSPVIDQALEDGIITQDQADDYLAQLEEAFTERVNFEG
ncbi:hypothetical protein [Agromyces sp. SYSU T0242]|uniref:hypothetical protein n=1 Tax=Agromyces litoreus TaxID=3158561 RepID=UPI0033941301